MQVRKSPSRNGDTDEASEAQRMSRSYLRDTVWLSSRVFLLWKILVWESAHGHKCEHEKGRKKGQERKKVSGTPVKSGKISQTGREESQGINSLQEKGGRE